MHSQGPAGRGMVQRDPRLMQTPQEAERLAVGQHCSHMLSGFGRVTCPLSLGAPGQTGGWRTDGLGTSGSGPVTPAGPFKG